MARRLQPVTHMMLHVIGFETEACGCLVGRYWNTVTARESRCVEAAAETCDVHHRNDLVAARIAVHPATRATGAA